MPTDSNGEDLKCGDKVYLPCTVVGIDRHEEYINAKLETDIPTYPSERPVEILVNAKQCVLMSHSLEPVEQEKAISAPDIPVGETKEQR